MTKMNHVLHEVAASYDFKKTDDTIYQNTALLLELYSKVVWRLKLKMDEMDQECKEMTARSLIETINCLVEVDTRIKVKRLAMRLSSVENSTSIIEFIDICLSKLKDYPNEGQKYYDILFYTYINRTDMPIESVAEIIGVSRSTLFREKKKAINLFGVILWGYIFHEIKN